MGYCCFYSSGDKMSEFFSVELMVFGKLLGMPESCFRFFQYNI